MYFYQLGKESLFTDEYFSLHVAQQPLSNIIFRHNELSNPITLPPFYELLMHFWLKVFGMSEAAQRSLTALCGVLSVYALYRLACLIFGIGTGILSAIFGLFSFSWFFYFRQNTCYGLFIFLSLLSFYNFFAYLKKRNSFYLILLTLVNALLIYTHYLGYIIILLELLFFMIERKSARKYWQDTLFMCI
jgi:4-amino-4-deoxy-L-arabinose transferase-like glycosyltransferase